MGIIVAPLLLPLYAIVQFLGAKGCVAVATGLGTSALLSSIRYQQDERARKRDWEKVKKE